MLLVLLIHKRMGGPVDGKRWKTRQQKNRVCLCVWYILLQLRRRGHVIVRACFLMRGVFCGVRGCFCFIFLTFL